jgi:hypothetical protein
MVAGAEGSGVLLGELEARNKAGEALQVSRVVEGGGSEKSGL